MSDDVGALLAHMRDDILSDPEKTYAIENALMILIQELEHVHGYNLFKIIFEVMGFYSSAIDKYLSEIDDESQISVAASYVDEIQEKFYYMVLKATLLVAKIRYGSTISRKVNPVKGDMIMDVGMERIMKVEMVSLEPLSVDSKSNPSGILLHCKDALTDALYKHAPNEVFVIALSFDDVKSYNYKKASRMAVEAGDDSNLSHYKSLLAPFVRNKERKNPLDKQDEKKEPPTFDAYLAEQRKYFEREGGDMIAEYLLDKCRKVRDYVGKNVD